MATILVTGACGDIGRWTVDALVDDHEVIGVDLDRPRSAGIDGATYRAVDLTEQGPTLECIDDANPDLVVHLAAVPGAGIRPEGDTFVHNAASAYHVLDAAGRTGATVIWTSSEATYGVTYRDEARPLEFLPIDETHPQRPLDGYGLSKVVGETIAARTHRRYEVPVVSMQPTWVQMPGRYETPAIREAFDLSDPIPSGSLWSYVDVRDVASFIATAVEADLAGHERYLLVAEDNYLGVETEKAIEAAWGSLPEACSLAGEQTAFSSEKARRELGWEPIHTWREAERASVVEPGVDE